MTMNGWTPHEDGTGRLTKESTDVDELRAWHDAHGFGSVEYVSSDEGDWRTSRSADKGWWSDVGRFITDGWPWRMVAPAGWVPAPVLPEGAPADAVPSPWTEGAVWCEYRTVPDGWLWRYWKTGAWRIGPGTTAIGALVEARPVPQPATETITPTPETVGTLLGRTPVEWQEPIWKVEARADRQSTEGVDLGWWTACSWTGVQQVRGWGCSVTVLRENPEASR